MLKNRRSGILCPIFSLPSDEGIGTLGRASYDFIDFLSGSGQKYWQVLPIGPTSIGDSPYQSFSSFAGNPYFIDLNILVDKGFLSVGDIQDMRWGNLEQVDYALLWETKYQVLRRAFDNSQFASNMDFSVLLQYPWLEDYAHFMALKSRFGGISRSTWPEGSLKKLYSKDLLLGFEHEIAFHVFLQIEFYQQWTNLRTYANSKGIEIIGDLPIFVSEDSADLWAHPEIFQLNDAGSCINVAGVPPDYFSEDGQLWGNPLYNWDYLKKTNFSWWISRIIQTFDLFDVLRIDHFRGFESYWSIPSHAEKATEGQWIKCPGRDFFDCLLENLESVQIIAEDLGILTDEVIELMDYLKFPGMKVLQFAFDNNPNNPYKPHNITENSVVYTGTHDNDTTKGWFLDTRNQESCHNAIQYMNLTDPSPEEFTNKFIELAFASSANLVITPIQDLLCLGTEARINTPATVGNNWKWRMKAVPSSSIQQQLLILTERTGRSG